MWVSVSDDLNFTDEYDPFMLTNISRSVISDETQSIHRFTCHDDFYCQSSYLSLFRSICIGWVGLGLSVFCIVANLLVISVMGTRMLRSTCNTYLTTVLLADTLRVLLYALIHVVSAIPIGPSEQRMVYQKVVVYYLPSLHGLLSAVETLITFSLIGGIGVLFTSYRHQNCRPSNTSLFNSGSLSIRTARLAREPSLLHHPRRTMFIAIFILSLLCSGPAFIKYKLIEVENADRVKNAIIRLTSVYVNNMTMYMLFTLFIDLICNATLAGLIFILACYYRNTNSSQSMKTSSSVVQQDIYEDIIVDRRRMERAMLLYIGSFWLLSCVSRTAQTMVVFCTFHSNSSLDVTVLDENSSSLPYFMAIEEFLVILCAPLRTVACLVTGTYVRRLVKNLCIFWLFPAQSNLRNSLKERIQSQLTTNELDMSITQPSKAFRPSASASLLPLMLESKAFTAMNQKRRMSAQM
ncbi:uncharacterized protein DEA37_0004320 [Paragonimus westermani]|uniref:Uncharacterized protein n=1 Tax=Paragonimus westermani TaxID=34504 RepID=A0A5J4P4F2_9TREM|nr:uncharacterized protein DEA37_0004320 [Paragonimus westermani]